MGRRSGSPSGSRPSICWCWRGCRVPRSDAHLIEYGVVALFIHEALTERVSQGRRVPGAALLAASLAILLGVIDEFIQLYLPSRVFDPVDIMFNVLAAVMAVAASSALGWARKQRTG